MSEDNNNFAVPKRNLLWILAGFAVMIAGYILLSGGASSDTSVFSPEIFSVRRLYVAPAVILLGCVIVVVSIMKRFKGTKNNEVNNKKETKSK